MDSLIDLFMYELMEVTVDPCFTAWLNNQTENIDTADFCNFSYAARDEYYRYDDFPGVHENSLRVSQVSHCPLLYRFLVQSPLQSAWPW